MREVWYLSLAGPTRLELATSGLTGRRSNQLNYDPKIRILFIFFVDQCNRDKDNSRELFHDWAFKKENYIFFIAGIISVIVGYIVMATGETYSFQSLSVAPILLFVGYIILIPLALIYKKDK